MSFDHRSINLFYHQNIGEWRKSYCLRLPICNSEFKLYRLSAALLIFMTIPLLTLLRNKPIELVNTYLNFTPKMSFTQPLQDRMEKLYKLQELIY